MQVRAHPMLQNDGRSIIPVGSIVLKTVHYPSQRGKNRRARRHKHIQANVYTAPFRAFIALYFVSVGGVKRAGLVVTTNGNFSISGAHGGQNLLMQQFGIGDIRVVAQFGAAYTTIQPKGISIA